MILPLPALICVLAGFGLGWVLRGRSEFDRGREAERRRIDRWQARHGDMRGITR